MFSYNTLPQGYSHPLYPVAEIVDNGELFPVTSQLVAWSQQQCGYLHHGNWQALQVRLFLLEKCLLNIYQPTDVYPTKQEDRKRNIGQWLPEESLLVLGKHIKAFMLVDFVSTPFSAQDPFPSTWQAGKVKASADLLSSLHTGVLSLSVSEHCPRWFSELQD